MIIDVHRRTLLVLEEVEGVCCRTAVGALLVVLDYELALRLGVVLGLVLRIELSYCCCLLSNMLVSAVERHHLQ